MKKIILLLAIFLTACTGEAAPTQEANALMATQAITTPTMTRVPAPTLDHAATIAVAQTQAEDERQNAYRAQQEAINAQQTSVAAGVELARITAEYEAGKIVIAQITQAAYATGEAHTVETLIAKPTADAKQATQQAIEVTRLANQSGLMTQVAEEPARIREINNAVNIERFGWLDYFARAMGSIAMIVLAGGVLMILYVRTEPKKQPIEEPEQPFIIPLNVDTSDGGWRATRAEVPVDIETLKLFADGIMQGMTPAYDVWQGVIKRPDLSQIRGFLLRELMAQKVKGEEVTIIQKGRDFLAHVSETGECPLPYRCIEPKTTTPADVDTANVDAEAVGEPELHPL